MIVIVDDNLDIASILARLLRRAGYVSETFTGGKEFLAHLLSKNCETPELVILDVMMPEMHGLECLSRIRANPAWEQIPVIMYSADSSPDRMREARQLGAQDYLVKGSLSWENFLSTLSQYTTHPSN